LVRPTELLAPSVMVPAMIRSLEVAPSSTVQVRAVPLGASPRDSEPRTEDGLAEAWLGAVPVAPRRGPGARDWPAGRPGAGAGAPRQVEAGDRLAVEAEVELAVVDEDGRGVANLLGPQQAGRGAAADTVPDEEVALDGADGRCVEHLIQEQQPLVDMDVLQV